MVVDDELLRVLAWSRLQAVLAPSDELNSWAEYSVVWPETEPDQVTVMVERPGGRHRAVPDLLVRSDRTGEAGRLGPGGDPSPETEETVRPVVVTKAASVIRSPVAEGETDSVVRPVPEEVARLPTAEMEPARP